MSKAERLYVPLSENLIDPELIIHLAEEARREAVSFADNVINKDVLKSVEEELTADRVSSGRILPHRAEQRIRIALLARNKIDIPLYKDAKAEIADLPLSASAQLVEEVHEGLMKVARPKRRIKLDLKVLYYSPGKFSTWRYAVTPHVDSSFKYFQAILTIHGTADFYWEDGMGFNITEGFRSEPKSREVGPGTLVVMRAGNMKRYGSAPAHAVGFPKNTDGERMGIAIGYVSRKA